MALGDDEAPCCCCWLLLALGRGGKEEAAPCAGGLRGVLGQDDRGGLPGAVGCSMQSRIAML